MEIDFGAQVDAAGASALALLTDNAPLLLLLPVAWVGYRVVRKILFGIDGR